MCPISLAEAESVDHLLNCEVAQSLWSPVVGLFDCFGVFPDLLSLGIIWKERNCHCQEGDLNVWSPCSTRLNAALRGLFVRWMPSMGMA